MCTFRNWHYSLISICALMHVGVASLANNWYKFHHLWNSMTPKAEKAREATWKEEKPERLDKLWNCFPVLSLPPTVMNMRLSKVETNFEASVGSGDSGNMNSTTITFPFSGNASLHFLRISMHLSSDQLCNTAYIVT